MATIPVTVPGVTNKAYADTGDDIDVGGDLDVTGTLDVTGAVTVDDLTATGTVIFSGLPTADPEVVGQLWSNNGVLTVSAGA